MCKVSESLIHSKCLSEIIIIFIYYNFFFYVTSTTSTSIVVVVLLLNTFKITGNIVPCIILIS